MIATTREIANLRARLRRMPDGQRRALRREMMWFVERARAPRLRTMREFAEQEIVIPDGPFEGRRFTCDRQPYTRLLFDAIDSGHWNRIVATGPTQSGKTLSAFVIPTLYHLFEVGETVICGLPQLEMASDKWREDLLPAIERSRFRELLPTRGAGSKGASKLTSITFTNGATLRFMGAGGGDKQRAGFTSRVVVITETDGMDEAGEASREADKVTQIEARTRAYGDRKRIYMECTVSIEEGRTWTEYKAGTESRLALPCPHCRAWVTPEREHLAGWKDATSKIDAKMHAHLICPACKRPWTEDERKEANRAALLVHRGQEIDTSHGEVKGDAPRTDTLGFRWTAANNCFVTMGDVGADEWRASRAVDEDVADREMCQFVWALPAKPMLVDTTKLDPHDITRRTSEALPGRGIIPRNRADVLTMAVDLGKHLMHWMLVGWHRETAAGHIVDYGTIEVPSKDMDVEVALLATLRTLTDDQIEGGWPVEDATEDGGPRRQPDQVWIDSGWQPRPVYAFTRERNRGVALRHHRFRPTKGYGRSQDRTSGYRGPQQSNNQTTPLISDNYHLSKVPSEYVFLMHVNSDHWKTYAHHRLAAPLTGEKAKSEAPLTVFRAQPHEHLSLARHLTAERETEEFEADKGRMVIRWERVRPDNHYLDCLYLNCAAAHFAGVRLLSDRQRDAERAERETAAADVSRTPQQPRLPEETASKYAFRVSRDDD